MVRVVDHVLEGARPALRNIAVGNDSSRHVVTAPFVGDGHVDVDVRIDPVDLAHDARDRRAFRAVELAGDGVMRGGVGAERERTEHGQ